MQTRGESPIDLPTTGSVQQHLRIQKRLQQPGHIRLRSCSLMQHMQHGPKKAKDAMSTVFQLPRGCTAGMVRMVLHSPEARDDAFRRRSEVRTALPRLQGPDAILICMAFLCLYATAGQTSVNSLICWAADIIKMLAPNMNLHG